MADLAGGVDRDELPFAAVVLLALLEVGRFM